MDIKDTIACVSQNLIGADVIIFTCPCLTADHVRGITASCLSIKYSAKVNGPDWGLNDFDLPQMSLSFGERS